MEKETTHPINQEPMHTRSPLRPEDPKPSHHDISLESTELISFEFHNEGLKRIISELTQKSKHQLIQSETLGASLGELREDFLLLRHEFNRLEERRGMREVEIENKFRKREEAEFMIKHEMNLKHEQIKGQLKEMDFKELRNEVKEFVERKKRETMKEVEESLGKELEQVRASLLSRMYEDTSTMIIEATNRIQQEVEQETQAVRELKKELTLHSKVQEKRLEEFLKESSKYFEKNDEKLRAFKEDILQSVPAMMLGMLENKREEDDGKLKELIEQEESKRRLKETLIEEKIDAIEEKEKRLQQLIKEFEIQILVLGNNVAARGTSERRGSKLNPMNTNNVNYAKKMSYDVMIEKILLAEEQIAANGRINQALKEKVLGLESELRNNPILANLAENPYIRQLLDNMLQNSLRSMESKIADKLDVETHYKHLKESTQRMDLLTLSVIDKCEKQEVKKALKFLEEKIKDVIILVGGITGDEGKDPFIEKKEIFKCLSCDKTVDREKDFLKTATTEYRVWKKVSKENSNTERVNQLGLGNSSSIKRLLRTGTAKNTERVKIICNN